MKPVIHHRMPLPSKFKPQVFAKRVRALIEREEASLRTVADRAGVDYTVLSRLGTSTTLEPRLPTLWNLADYFEVSLDYLAGRRPEEQEIDGQAKRLLAIWAKLPPDQRAELLRLAKEMEKT